MHHFWKTEYFLYKHVKVSLTPSNVEQQCTQTNICHHYKTNVLHCLVKICCMAAYIVNDNAVRGTKWEGEQETLVSANQKNHPRDFYHDTADWSPKL